MGLTFANFGRMGRMGLLPTWGKLLKTSQLMSSIEAKQSPKSKHEMMLIYYRVMVSQFPNLFLLTGPNTLPSGHSTLLGIEASVAYILRLLKPLLQKKCAVVSTKNFQDRGDGKGGKDFQPKPRAEAERSCIYHRGQLLVYQR